MPQPIAIATSRGGIPIRITYERWTHVVENHDYMADNMDKVVETIRDPDYIVSGNSGEKVALKHYLQTSISEKHVVVVYREKGTDGFLVTAFMTSDQRRILEKGILWQAQ